MIKLSNDDARLILQILGEYAKTPAESIGQVNRRRRARQLGKRINRKLWTI